MNCVALIALSLLSVKLFQVSSIFCQRLVHVFNRQVTQVYTTESLSRVGASAKIHRMYKVTAIIQFVDSSVSAIFAT